MYGIQHTYPKVLLYELKTYFTTAVLYLTNEKVFFARSALLFRSLKTNKQLIDCFGPKAN